MAAKTFATCSPWLNMYSLPVLVHFGWTFCLMAVTLYQVGGFKKKLNSLVFFIVFFYDFKLWYLGLTTNEKLNKEKYKCFKDKDGNFVNPYRYKIFIFNF